MRPSIMFVTPLMSRRYCRDWLRLNMTLGATVRSLQRQTDPNWRMLLVGGDEPEIGVSPDERIVFIKADLEIDDPSRAGRRVVDKERKQYCGFVELKTHQPDYVMSLDYDDLLNVRLVEHVS